MNDQLLWFATRGAGIVSLVFLTGLADAQRGHIQQQLGFHRNLALLSVAFLGAHIVTAVLDPFTRPGHHGGARPVLLVVPNPVAGPRRPGLGPGRRRFSHQPPEEPAPHVARRPLALVPGHAWPLALLHGVGAGTDAAAPWMIAVYLTCLAVVGSAVLVRITAGGSRRAAATPIMAGMQPSTRAATGATPGATVRPPAGP